MTFPLPVYRELGRETVHSPQPVGWVDLRKVRCISAMSPQVQVTEGCLCPKPWMVLCTHVPMFVCLHVCACAFSVFVSVGVST